MNVFSRPGGGYVAYVGIADVDGAEAPYRTEKPDYFDSKDILAGYGVIANWFVACDREGKDRRFVSLVHQAQASSDYIVMPCGFHQIHGDKGSEHTQEHIACAQAFVAQHELNEQKMQAYAASAFEAIQLKREEDQTKAQALARDRVAQAQESTLRSTFQSLDGMDKLRHLLACVGEGHEACLSLPEGEDDPLTYFFGSASWHFVFDCEGGLAKLWGHDAFPAFSPLTSVQKKGRDALVSRFRTKIKDGACNAPRWFFNNIGFVWHKDQALAERLFSGCLDEGQKHSMLLNMSLLHCNISQMLDKIPESIMQKIIAKQDHQRIVFEALLYGFDAKEAQPTLCFQMAEMARNLDAQGGLIALFSKLVQAKKHDLVLEMIKKHEEAKGMHLEDDGLFSALCEFFDGKEGYDCIQRVVCSSPSQAVTQAAVAPSRARRSASEGGGGARAKKNPRPNQPAREKDALEDRALDDFEGILADVLTHITDRSNDSMFSPEAFQTLRSKYEEFFLYADVLSKKKPIAKHNLCFAIALKHWAKGLQSEAVVRDTKGLGADRIRGILEDLSDQAWAKKPDILNDYQRLTEVVVVTIHKLLNKVSMVRPKAKEASGGAKKKKGRKKQETALSFYDGFWFQCLQGMVVFLQMSGMSQYFSSKESPHRAYYQQHLFVSLLIMAQDPKNWADSQKNDLGCLIRQHIITHYFLVRFHELDRESHHYERLVTHVKSFLVVLTEYMPSKQERIKKIGKAFCGELLSAVCSEKDRLDRSSDTGLAFMYHHHEQDFASFRPSSLPEAPVQVMRIFCALGLMCSRKDAPGKIFFDPSVYDKLSSLYPPEALGALLSCQRNALALSWPGLRIDKEDSCGAVSVLYDFFKAAAALPLTADVSMGLSPFELFCLQDHSKTEQAVFESSFKSLLSRMFMDDLFQSRYFSMPLKSHGNGVFFKQSANVLLGELYTSLHAQARIDLAVIIMDRLRQSGFLSRCVVSDPILFARYTEFFLSYLSTKWDSFLHLVDCVPRTLFVTNNLGQDLIKEHFICFNDFVCEPEDRTKVFAYFKKLIDLYFVQGVDWQKIDWGFILDQAQQPYMPDDLFQALKRHIQSNINHAVFVQKIKDYFAKFQAFNGLFNRMKSLDKRKILWGMARACFKQQSAFERWKGQSFVTVGEDESKTSDLAVQGTLRPGALPELLPSCGIQQAGQPSCSFDAMLAHLSHVDKEALIDGLKQTGQASFSFDAMVARLSCVDETFMHGLRGLGR